MKVVILPLVKGEEHKITDEFTKQKYENEVYSLKENEINTYVDRENGSWVHIVGLGEKEKLTPKRAFDIVGGASRLKYSRKYENVIKIVDQGLSKDVLDMLVVGYLSGRYKFDKYKSDRKKLKNYTIDTGDMEINFNSARLQAEMTNYCRTLSNEPANVIYPASLAKKVMKLGKKKGFEVEVLGKEEIEELGMDSFLAVSSGSSKKPKLIVMRYFGDKESKEVLALVGKGITYDSGGYSLKTSVHMMTMNTDMTGGATVASAMAAIAQSKLKVNVVAIIAACENLVNGAAYKPGDIIPSMGGKSIFVGNTDAEGRLTLIDAVYYAKTVEKATRIVDIATLTGAARFTFGEIATSSISNNDEMFDMMSEAYRLGGENIGRLPIFEEYKELLKHEYADLTNIPKGPGTTMAGLFVAQFMDDVPYVHLDIAYTGMSETAKGPFAIGATGNGVRPLFNFAKLLSEKDDK